MCLYIYTDFSRRKAYVFLNIHDFSVLEYTVRTVTILNFNLSITQKNHALVMEKQC